MIATRDVFRPPREPFKGCTSAEPSILSRDSIRPPPFVFSVLVGRGRVAGMIRCGQPIFETPIPLPRSKV